MVKGFFSFCTCSMSAFEALSRQQIASRITFLGMMLLILVTLIISVIEPASLINNTFPGFLVNRRLVLSRYELFHWTGMQAGMHYPDKIIKANDQNLSSFKDLEKIIRSHPVGVPIKYTVERNKKGDEATVQTMVFTWRDFIQIYGFAFFSGIVYLLIGIGVFIARPDTLASWAFLLMCSVL